MLCSPEEALIIRNASWLSLIGSSIQWFYYNTRGLSIGTFSVFLTSQLYWKKPTYGCRRTMDMSVVFLVFLYYMYSSFHVENPHLYYVFTGTSICCYYVGWKEYNKGYTKRAAYIHSLIHLFANIANICMSASYTQKIDKLLLK